jgi:hypothetical protein
MVPLVARWSPGWLPLSLSVSGTVTVGTGARGLSVGPQPWAAARCFVSRGEANSVPQTKRITGP